MGQILKNLTKETEEICLFKTKLSDAWITFLQNVNAFQFKNYSLLISITNRTELLLVGTQLCDCHITHPVLTTAHRHEVTGLKGDPVDWKHPIQLWLCSITVEPPPTPWQKYYNTYNILARKSVEIPLQYCKIAADSGEGGNNRLGCLVSIFFFEQKENKHTRPNNSDMFTSILSVCEF
jgi:hypothetical protein